MCGDEKKRYKEEKKKRCIQSSIEKESIACIVSLCGASGGDRE